MIATEEDLTDGSVCERAVDSRRMGRRGFICGAGATALMGCAFKSAKRRIDPPSFMWAYLTQLGVKVWQKHAKFDELRVDDLMWDELVVRLAKRRLNVMVWDLAEGMVFPSHPELRVRGSWSPERVRREIERLKGLGILSIPKLNFSATHDHWLGKWRYALSLPEYYEICRDVVEDVAEVFSESPLFHLGFDEENFHSQDVSKEPLVRIRTGELWWRDFLFLVQEVEKHGMRPWIWSDFCWSHKDEFLQRMPRSVLQSNWYYGYRFNPMDLPEENRAELETYSVLDEAGYDQVPCGSSYMHEGNFKQTIDYCRTRIRPPFHKGFMMAPWYYATLLTNREKIIRSIDIAGAARERWELEMKG